MKKILSTTLALLFVFATYVAAQNTNSAATTSNPNTAVKARKPRKPIFRANKDQIKQAQKILRDRAFYVGEENGKLDDNTRTGLKKYQVAESLKETGTLNRATLEKMRIVLTDKQKAM